MVHSPTTPAMMRLDSEDLWLHTCVCHEVPPGDPVHVRGQHIQFLVVGKKLEGIPKKLLMKFQAPGYKVNGQVIPQRYLKIIGLDSDIRYSEILIYNWFVLGGFR